MHIVKPTTRMMKLGSTLDMIKTMVLKLSSKATTSKLIDRARRLSSEHEGFIEDMDASHFRLDKFDQLNEWLIRPSNRLPNLKDVGAATMNSSLDDIERDSKVRIIPHPIVLHLFS
jgi:hypothetical protein